MKFRLIIEQDEDGVFVANCPTLPGCISQGKTREEAQANIKEAIIGYLESLAKHGKTEIHQRTFLPRWLAHPIPGYRTVDTSGSRSQQPWLVR